VASAASAVYANGARARGARREKILVLFKCNGSIGSMRVQALACINKARRKHLYYWCRCVKYSTLKCALAPRVSPAPRKQHRRFSSPAGDTALLMRAVDGRTTFAISGLSVIKMRQRHGHFTAKCMRMLLRHAGDQINYSAHLCCAFSAGGLSRAKKASRTDADDTIFLDGRVCFANELGEVSSNFIYI
jgi:hypothetical protein